MKPKVRTDIRVTPRRVELGQRATKLLGIKVGQVLCLEYDNQGNALLYAIDDPEDKYAGRAYKISGGIGCANTSLAAELLNGAKAAKYRVGECVTWKSHRALSVITRINYAIQERDI